MKGARYPISTFGSLLFAVLAPHSEKHDISTFSLFFLLSPSFTAVHSIALTWPLDVRWVVGEEEILRLPNTAFCTSLSPPLLLPTSSRLLRFGAGASSLLNHCPLVFSSCLFITGSWAGGKSLFTLVVSSPHPSPVSALHRTREPSLQHVQPRIPRLAPLPQPLAQSGGRPGGGRHDGRPVFLVDVWSPEALRLGASSGGPRAIVSSLVFPLLPFVLVLTCASLLTGLLFSSLDTSIVSTSLVTVSQDLNDFVNAPWIVLAYLLTYMGMYGWSLCLGTVSD